jgi:uroporphyrinogen decarboxylase
MGLGLYFAEGEGPKFERPVRDERAVRALKAPDPHASLRYVVDAVSQIRRALDNRVPLIGFSGSPYTLACYMVEGGASDDFRTIKTMLYARPELLHALLRVNTDAVIAYLNAQIEAGAQAVMIFDTWGGSLSGSAYREYSLTYMAEIVSRLTRERDGVRVPVIVFTKGGSAWLDEIARTGCDVVGLDWATDLGAARQRIGDRVALQGNLDPAILFAPPARIEDEVAKVLAAYGSGPGHIFNLGHGVSQHTDPDHVHALVEAVHALSRHYH